VPADSDAVAPQIPNGSTTLAETLEMFAAGNAVPGSGSANALMGALGAALLASVAAKTLEHAKEPRYRPISTAAQDITRWARGWLRELLELVDEDAKAFAPVVALRRQGTDLLDQYNQDQALRKEIDATKPATEIPLRIAEIAIAIAEKAIVMIESGFEPARGESHSALLASLASADGGVYVAHMNIRSVSRKIEKLNDRRYERPWLRKVTTRATELEARTAAQRERERSLRERFKSTVRASTRQRKRKTAN
jgi:formiminotetrahydrofolate cyclodeaminase